MKTKLTLALVLATTLALGTLTGMRSARAAAEVVQTTYQIEIRTGCVNGAGTDARVHIALGGDSGYTPNFTNLDNPGVNDFERGRTDVFRVVGGDAGNISSLYIRHDNTGGAPGWLMRDVRVYNYRTGVWTNFPVQRWLAKDECDGATSLWLYPNVRPYCTPYYYGGGSGC